jgi:AraC-like DNA-binding protein
MNMPQSTSNSLTFNYKQEDYENWLKKFGIQVEAETVSNKIQYPENIATGYARAKNIEPGLSYRIVNYTLNADLELKRVPSEKFQLLLYFYELRFSEKPYCKAGNTIIESTDEFFSASLVTHSMTPQEIIFKKGTVVKGLSIQITEDWLYHNLLNFTQDKLEMIKQKDCLVDFISAKQRKILHDIFETGDIPIQLPELFIKSRVLRITEQFLTNLCTRGMHNIPQFTNQKDFQALLKVEYLLSKNYSAGFPSIESLAKTAYMSESKLKKLFKKAYGMAPYEYYQKNRMHKAKELLRSRKHSVSQVGSILGYQNMSNFSAAFKKEFDCLPSQAQEVF